MAGNIISSLFGRSPVKPLQNHMESVIRCADLLPQFIAATCDGDWDRASEVQKQISQKESEADDLKRDLRLGLPKSLFLPVSRRDLLEVLAVQDKIANRSKDIAGLMTGRKLEFPEVLKTNIQEFAQRSIDAVHEAGKVINQFDELVETGFSGKEVEFVESIIKQLDSIESDTDRIQVQVRAQLYEVEDQFSPIDVMFMYKIIEWIGEVGDFAQRVGSRLELMLAR